MVFPYPNGFDIIKWLVNRLKILAKNIQSTQVKGKNVQIFKDLKDSMDKYVLHSYFYVYSHVSRMKHVKGDGM
jgi:hypothetical protein